MITREDEIAVPVETIRRMSHDVRTPLTTIMGFAELLLEDPSLTGEQLEFLTIVRDESKRLAGMLEECLQVLSRDVD